MNHVWQAMYSGALSNKHIIIPLYCLGSHLIGWKAAIPGVSGDEITARIWEFHQSLSLCMPWEFPFLVLYLGEWSSLLQLWLTCWLLKESELGVFRPNLRQDTRFQPIKRNVTRTYVLDMGKAEDPDLKVWDITHKHVKSQNMLNLPAAERSCLVPVVCTSRSQP